MDRSPEKDWKSDVVATESSVLMISLQDALRQLDLCMNSKSPLDPALSTQPDALSSRRFPSPSPSPEAAAPLPAPPPASASPSAPAPAPAPGLQVITPAAKAPTVTARKELSGDAMMREYARATRQGGRASVQHAEIAVEPRHELALGVHADAEVEPAPEPGSEDEEERDVRDVRAQLDGCVSAHTQQSLREAFCSSNTLSKPNERSTSANRRQHPNGAVGPYLKPGLVQDVLLQEKSESVAPGFYQASEHQRPHRRDRKPKHRPEQQSSPLRAPSPPRRAPSPSQLLARYHSRRAASPSEAEEQPSEASQAPEQPEDPEPPGVPATLPHLKNRATRRAKTPEPEPEEPAQNILEVAGAPEVTLSPEDKAEYRAARARKRREYKMQLRREEAIREAAVKEQEPEPVPEPVPEPDLDEPLSLEPVEAVEPVHFSRREMVAGAQVRSVLDQVGAPSCRLDHDHTATCLHHRAASPLLPVSIVPRASKTPQAIGRPAELAPLDGATVAELKQQLKANLAAHQQALEEQYGQQIQELDKLEQQSSQQLAAVGTLRHHAAEHSEAAEAATVRSRLVQAVSSQTRDVLKSGLTQVRAGAQSPGGARAGARVIRSTEVVHTDRPLLPPSSSGRSPRVDSGQYHTVSVTDFNTQDSTATSPQQGKEVPILVRLLYNDGASRKNVNVATIQASTVQQLLEQANAKMDELPAVATRVFTTSGHELSTLAGAQDGLPVVVSCGEDFRPRIQPSATPRRVVQSPFKQRPASPPATTCSVTPQLDTTPPTLRKRLKVTLMRNDGGVSSKSKTVLVYTLRMLMDESAKALDLTRAARQIYTADGMHVTSISQLEDGMILVISTGEKFKPIRKKSSKSESLVRPIRQ